MRIERRESSGIDGLPGLERLEDLQRLGVHQLGGRVVRGGHKVAPM